MADSARARIGEPAHAAARLDDALTEPAIFGVGTEEVAGAHDEDAHAGAGRILEAALHCDADLALAGVWLLRRQFVDLRRRVGPEVVDRTR
jgi:hypothetical protein